MFRQDQHILDDLLLPQHNCSHDNDDYHDGDGGHEEKHSYHDQSRDHF